MSPQNSKHYHVPFGNDANFVNHSGVAAIKIQQFFQNSSSTSRIFGTSRSSRSAPVRVHVDVRNGHGRARGVEPPPEGGARTKLYSTENSSSANRILRPRQKTPDQIIHDTKEGFCICSCIYIYMYMF